MATAVHWTRKDGRLVTQGLQEAVVITDGLSGEQTDAGEKAMDEAAFRLEVLDKGIDFRCVDVGFGLHICS